MQQDWLGLAWRRGVEGKKYCMIQPLTSHVLPMTPSPHHYIHSSVMRTALLPVTYLLVSYPLLDKPSGCTELSLVFCQESHFRHPCPRRSQIQVTPNAQTSQLADRGPGQSHEGGYRLGGYRNLCGQTLGHLSRGGGE